MSLRRRIGHTVAMGSALTLIAACGGGGGDGGGDGGGGGDGRITVWTLENLPDRMAAQQQIASAFTRETGIDVKLVGIAEDQYSQLLTSAAAANELPDVIGALSLPGVRTLTANELANTDVADAVVDELGAETFSEQALELTSDGDTQLSVPSDGWVQLLVYRKDLFDRAGLSAPESFDDIMAAAQELDSRELAGFVGANAPNDTFTQQTFEHFALGNGCELVNEEGEILLDSEPCVNTFDFYGSLVRDYSVPGTQDVDTTRANYFAGEAAMLVWSSFVLDEMAGLRNDAKPTCPECRRDAAYLAENSGIVTAIQGPDGDEPAMFGEVVSWVATASADEDAAQRFITYMMDEAYMDWIGFAPEGKIPARQGNADDATAFIDEWGNLPAGVDTKAPLSQFYPPEVLETLRTSVDAIQRWGITQGQGDLAGAMLGQQPVANAVNAVTTGQSDPQAAAERAAEAVRSIQESL